MQTTRLAQRIFGSWSGAWDRALHLQNITLLGMLGVLIAATLLLATPTQAWAKSFTMPEVSIEAEVLDNGTLHVVERRTFAFNGTFSAVWWTQGSLPEFGSYQVNKVKMGVLQSYPDDTNSPELIPVDEVPFQTEWRSSGGPGTTAYSVDAPETTCYLFFDITDATMVAQIDYQIENAIQLYADCAELYWKYVADGWSEDSRNVTCTITLPAGGTIAEPGRDVRAWGHGSLEGTVSIENEGGTVVYEVPRVDAGDFAEARILFPRAWVGSPSAQVAQAHSNQEHLDSVLEEEQEWADRANRDRNLSRLGILGIIVAFLAPIGWSLWKFSRIGFEHRPTTTYDYWRDDPDPGVHPAVIARLCNWNKEDSDQLTATIVHLVNQGAFSIFKGTYEKNGRLTSKTEEDYRLDLNPNFQPETPLDQETIKLLFKKAGSGKDHVWLHQISDYAKRYPSACSKANESWHRKLDQMVKEQDYFELEGERTKNAIYGVAAALVIVGFAGLSAGVWPMLVLLFPAIVMFIVGHFAPRRTQHGADVYEKCKALKRWLTEFSTLNERPAADVKVWGHFMVYALVFGVAAKALAELRKAAPEIFQQAEAMAAGDSSYVPFYYYYDTVGDSVGSSLSFANVVSNVTSAVSAAASPSSDGGGGGGGFSGGGGGGFGGGGGGGAR